MPRIRIFRIFYSSTYTFFLLLLLGMLVVSPGDHIYQTLKNGKVGNLFVVAGTYLVTAIIALFIYASRLYTNKAILAAMPRSYLPIEKGEVGEKVHKIIVRNRQRSAIIAWESRPRDLRPETSQTQETVEATERPSSRRKLPKTSTIINSVIPISNESPPWGPIAHPGWSSPLAEDMPEIRYEEVFRELPNLIEARGVALATAPADPETPASSEQPQVIAYETNSDVITLLERLPALGLNGYLLQLVDLEMLPDQGVVDDFVGAYEKARFSPVPLTDGEFRRLMSSFSRLLSSMKAPEEDAAKSYLVGHRDTPSSSSSSVLFRPKSSAGESLRPVVSRSSVGSSRSVVRRTPDHVNGSPIMSAND